ncbi:hypothetical protein [Nocardia sp. NPDC024068]|uniref:hypothetical protein n=1 Tax=Nocardia sp. NPDC024068 TaxID=3157197 RepID=UPI0033E9CEC6
MSEKRSSAVRSTVLATTLFGFVCGIAVLAVAAVWWKTGPDSVSCYYATYDPDPAFDPFDGMVGKMWPTRWFWAGLIVAPTVVGALSGLAATRFGIRLHRVPHAA